MVPICVSIPSLLPCFLGDICIYACRVHSEGRQKACRPTAPKMSPRRSASQRNVSKGAGMPMLFCSKHARLNFRNFRHVYSQRQCTGPWAQTPAPPDIKVDLLPHSAKQLHQERQQGWLLWVATLIPGERGHVCAHTSRGSSVKLAIRIGLAAKLLRMCSKATKHGIAFRIGLAAKLRMRSKATQDNFAIRPGSAAKLLRKCSKEYKK